MKPLVASSFFASRYVAAAVFGESVWWKTSWTITPVYSGYMLILPLVSEVWISSVEPMFSLYETVEALRLERLLVELSEDVLLGEVLGADHDRRRGATGAGRAKAAANKPMTIATPREIAKAALAARRVCFRITATPFVEFRCRARH